MRKSGRGRLDASDWALARSAGTENWGTVVLLVLRLGPPYSPKGLRQLQGWG